MRKALRRRRKPVPERFVDADAKPCRIFDRGGREWSVGYRGLFIAAFLAAACGACAVVDPVDTRYDTISRSIAKARNEAIFLNLIRASHDYPLSFVTISNVTPTMTNASSLGLPSFILGPISSVPSAAIVPYGNALLSNTTGANSTSVSSNFNISTQETSAFYQGFLKPIDLVTLNYFIRQGYPRELLFWLFTDSFELTTPYGRFGYRFDPPSNYGCSAADPKHRCFGDWVHLAALAGLTVEEKFAHTAGRGGGPGPGKRVYAKFCFSKILGEQAQAIVQHTDPSVLQKLKQTFDISGRGLYASPLRCGDPSWDPEKDAEKPQSDVLPLRSGPFTFRIVPRSAYGVFVFLGTIIRMQTDHVAPLHGAIPSWVVSPEGLTRPPLLATVPEDAQLVTVLRSPKDRCFSQTWFYDGDYCVPESATTTKRIFSLLAQLIAITTAATDLSITPVVRVIQ
jgi:hypothetical protein